jgi:hypothetical protein
MGIEQFKYRLPEADTLYAAALAAGGYTRFSQENMMDDAVIQTVLFNINDTTITLQVTGKRGKNNPLPQGRSCRNENRKQYASRSPSA